MTQPGHFPVEYLRTINVHESMRGSRALVDFLIANDGNSLADPGGTMALLLASNLEVVNAFGNILA